ncbi:TlpA family protein disulfide reductase [Rhodopirellula europaea]|uniref:TlpA family protein disulfide reductase n=1 Tax=Rhodopirellula europaea TaxID=1263866 RepID=UPI003D2A966F
MLYRKLVSLATIAVIFVPLSHGQDRVVITAQNADGSRVSEFEAMLAVDGGRHTQWEESNEGSVSFEAYQLEVRNVGPTEGKANLIASADVFVRAPGYATTSQSLELVEGITRSRLVLHEGRVVTLKLQDASERAIPKDLRPVLLPAQYREDGLYDWQMKETSRSRDYQQSNWYRLQWMMPGSYQLRVTDETPDLFLNIDDHDFLRAFESGSIPVSAVKDAPIVVTLPKTASLKTGLVYPEAIIPTELPIASMRVSLSRPDSKGSSHLFPMSSEELTEPTAEYSIAHLAPGELYLSISTISSNHVPYGKPDPGSFRTGGKIQIEPGERKELIYPYKQFSQRPFKGDKQVTIHVVDGNGLPVDGKPFEVQFSDRNFGSFQVKKGEIVKGQIKLIDLKATDELEFPERFTLIVNQRRIGRFAVGGAAIPPQIERFQLPPDVGDQAVTLSVSDLETGSPVTVKFDNRITLLEFWATWCGPCQRPMDELNQIARDKSWKSGERVQLISISIDESSELVQKHLQGKNWLATRNLIDQQKGDSDQNSVSYKGVTARRYCISGVPTAVLIDSSGTIVYRGHPSELNLVDMIEQLLVE